MKKKKNLLAVVVLLCCIGLFVYLLYVDRNTVSAGLAVDLNNAEVSETNIQDLWNIQTEQEVLRKTYSLNEERGIFVYNADAELTTYKAAENIVEYTEKNSPSRIKIYLMMSM